MSLTAMAAQAHRRPQCRRHSTGRITPATHNTGTPVNGRAVVALRRQSLRRVLAYQMVCDIGQDGGVCDAMFRVLAATEHVGNGVLNGESTVKAAPERYVP